MKRPKIIVIGAGMGGLAAAADLARNNCDVTVLERAATCGGKMRQIRIGTTAIDAGPTVFTMKWVFDALFADAGLAFDDHLTLVPVEILARHAWASGGKLDLYADTQKSAEAIDEFAGAREASGYLAFCERSRRIFETLRGPFIESQRPGPLELVRRLGFQNLGAMLDTAPHQTMWSALGQYFKDERLQQLFGRYATYCGSSPFWAPATLMLVSHVEQTGVWRVKGGMAAVSSAMHTLGKYVGAHFRFECSVAQILVQRGRVCGVELENGETLVADAIVFNGDLSALGLGLLGKKASNAAKPVAPTNRTQSAITWCINARTQGMALAHHSVLFSDDYRAEFNDVFKARTPPKSPTVYICAQDRDDTCTAPDGAERLLILINAPADGDLSDNPAFDPAQAKQAAWRIMQQCGLTIDMEQSVQTIPTDFHALFPGTGGALYGRANHSPFASFQRPGARSALRGLYLAGGSVHPGPGIPMATLSGRLAAAQLLKDYGKD
ncbi:1-hydroxycarotenoid 3,4-desaturase CrtD [Candidatus Phycosocius spiralis]|uniref:Phytoene desaturase n=1 Tax=Candidatus Phycosocius spiralis TaxID=2815099 RepID=A0ABQ4PUA1_9PROT|nr:1-hydroxycarotenoid 3,4-desaturase CrtD [Candidatus Phycosocius spiralis]GIU66565.1 phytoene desaturase [Candidatus Phycosocius spiralis]